jgi:hypothetical protein
MGARSSASYEADLQFHSESANRACDPGKVEATDSDETNQQLIEAQDDRLLGIID